MKCFKPKYVTNIRFLVVLAIFLMATQIQSQVVSYADSGNGIHQEKILWLTWDNTMLSDGIHDGDSVLYNLPLGGTLEVTFSNVSVAYPIPDPTPGDGELAHGYLPSNIYTWCGATLYTAYDISTSDSEILFSDIDSFGNVGNGENGQDISFDVTMEMIINGTNIPVDIIIADPETTNPAFQEEIKVGTNASNWELVENILGSNYVMNGLGTDTLSILDTETGFGCSGGNNNGGNSSPIIMSKGVAGTTTVLSYEVLYPIGDGHEGIILGILLPFDQGDAPFSYGDASHLQDMGAVTTGGPDIENNSTLYLGVNPGDDDYNPFSLMYSTNAKGDDDDDIDDEDGLLVNNANNCCNALFLTIPAESIELNNGTGYTATLHAWIDFNENGIFETDEYTSVSVNDGDLNPNEDLNFPIPSGASSGNLFLRLRLTTDPSLNSSTPLGIAIDGEVEDHKIVITYCSNIYMPSVSACIDHPLQDIATLSLDLDLPSPLNDTLLISVLGSQYVILTDTVTSYPMSLDINVPADGRTDNLIHLTWGYYNQQCQDSILFDAPSPCSDDSISCNILYLCGDDKPSDGYAWDHGWIEYLDDINGSADVDPIFTKDEAGMGTYDPVNTNTFINVDFSDYDLIIVSATTESHISTDLIDAMKGLQQSIVVSNYLAVQDFDLSNFNISTAFQDHLYTDDINFEDIYNYQNDIDPSYSRVFTRMIYRADGDGYLWTGSGNQTTRTNNVYMHYESSDVFPNITSHGPRTFFGFHMNGVFANQLNNSPISSDEEFWFHPTKDLTTTGKIYFDHMLIEAGAQCNLNCNIATTNPHVMYQRASRY